MVFYPHIRRCVPNRILSWLGRVVCPGLFVGHHRFEIVAAGRHHIRFSQHETFSGLLVHVVRNTFEGPTMRGFRQMNEPLEKRSVELFGQPATS